MAEVSRRRTDQFGNLMRVLELGAINLDAGARIPEQALRHSFHHAGFPSRWPRGTADFQQGVLEDSIPPGTSGRFPLPSRWLRPGQQSCGAGHLKLPGIIATTGRIQHGVKDGFHKGVALLGAFVGSWERGVNLPRLRDTSLPSLVFMCRTSLSANGSPSSPAIPISYFL